MDTGELFRLKEGSKEQKEMIFRVENSHNLGCEDCAGLLNKPLCKRLPDCYNSKSEPAFKFVKLNSIEAKRAIKQKLTINQY